MTQNHGRLAKILKFNLYSFLNTNSIGCLARAPASIEERLRWDLSAFFVLRRSLHTNTIALKRLDAMAEVERNSNMQHSHPYDATVASTPPPNHHSSPSHNGLSWSQSVEMKTQEVS